MAEYCEYALNLAAVGNLNLYRQRDKSIMEKLIGENRSF